MATWPLWEDGPGAGARATWEGNSESVGTWSRTWSGEEAGLPGGTSPGTPTTGTSPLESGAQGVSAAKRTLLKVQWGVVQGTEESPRVTAHR